MDSVDAGAPHVCLNNSCPSACGPAGEEANDGRPSPSVASGSTPPSHACTPPPPSPPATSVPRAAIDHETYKRESYLQQVDRWMAEEKAFLSNPGWCECRFVILLQEAFASSHRHLKEECARGCISRAELRTYTVLLKEAFQAIKAEFRRTLDRLKRGNAPSADLAALVTRGITTIAGVYPWSSPGFLLYYAENQPPGSPTIRSAGWAHPSCSPVPPLPFAGAPASVPMCDGRRSSDLQRRCVPLTRPTPACNQLDSHPSPPFASPLRRSELPPQRYLPPTVTGPIGTDEMRFLEKRQLAQSTRAFAVMSLTAMPFFNDRRVASVMQRMKQRLQALPSLPAPPTLLICGRDNSGEYYASDPLSPPSCVSPSSNSSFSQALSSLVSDEFEGGSGSRSRSRRHSDVYHVHPIIQAQQHHQQHGSGPPRSGERARVGPAAAVSSAEPLHHAVPNKTVPRCGSQAGGSGGMTMEERRQRLSALW